MAEQTNREEPAGAGASLRERVEALICGWRIQRQQWCDAAPGLRDTYAKQRVLARAEMAGLCADDLADALSASAPVEYHAIPREQDGPIRIALEMRSAAHYNRTHDATTRSALAGWADRLDEWMNRDQSPVEEPGGWRDIATLDRDRTDNFLVWCHENRNTYLVIYRDGAFYVFGGNLRELGEEPTHWHERPAPPTARKDE